MTDQEYAETQREIVEIAKAIRGLRIADFIHRIGTAEVAAHLLDEDIGALKFLAQRLLDVQYAAETFETAVFRTALVESKLEDWK